MQAITKNLSVFFGLTSICPIGTVIDLASSLLPRQNRGGMSSNIPVRAARELYFPTYQGAVDAGVGACMLGTNAVNGTKNYNNSEVIGYLKGPMGFDGFVMTDWDG